MIDELDEKQLSAIVVDCAFRLHVEAGPGMLEVVYELTLERMLSDRGLQVTRQVQVPLTMAGLLIEDAFRVDLLVNSRLVVELKSVEQIAPVHLKQVNTYLRLLNLPLGLLINFGAATFKQGVRRVVNRHTQTQNSLLRLYRDHASPN
ncbi:MAG: GxxExxY protein [Verrucomicrobia bacterium]|nr:GxxExxY protein [Verrucomicrobiota bacterium]